MHYPFQKSSWRIRRNFRKNLISGSEMAGTLNVVRFGGVSNVSHVGNTSAPNCPPSSDDGDRGPIPLFAAIGIEPTVS
ncbi:hypothetical protein CEXT_40961 [Caerostris extrusa]|uniref:Uncharacterized protein n=1 Tax=Caerostris extrusa TaxID=172846 RepID=A0AAV4XRV0_CAEEX|nr:hypothetical protein CEXT_40961 [Caerostris extrusa]